MKQLDLFVHAHEPSITQEHLNDNRTRFSKQCQDVLDHLLLCGSIQQNEARVMYNITRLASRIHDLKSSGIDIDREMVRCGKTNITRYSLTTK